MSLLHKRRTQISFVISAVLMAMLACTITFSPPQTEPQSGDVMGTAVAQTLQVEAILSSPEANPESVPQEATSFPDVSSSPTQPSLTQTPPDQPQSDIPESDTPEPPVVDLSSLVCKDEQCAAGDVRINYLIVTRPMFVEALAPFIQWKTSMGFKVGLVTADWLVQNYSGRHMAENMKNGMHDLRRRASDSQMLFVLLVGDTEIEQDNFHVNAVLSSYDLSLPWNVPTGFYRRMKNDPADEVLPSDAYYVEDRDWDPGNSGLNPVEYQEHGQGTFDASLYLGRWSVREDYEIPPIVDKTRSVVPASRILFTQDGTFGDTGCCTSWPPSGYIGNNNYACCYINNDVVLNQLFNANAPWLTTDILGVDIKDTAQTDHLMQVFQNYDGAIVQIYHGLYYCMQMAENQCMTISDFQFQTNFPLLEAGSCYIAAFYSGPRDTLAESFLKSSTGPAIVSQAGHNTYHYMDGLRNGLPIGDAFWRSGAEYVYWLNPIVLLGDPSLPVLQGP